MTYSVKREMFGLLVPAWRTSICQTGEPVVIKGPTHCTGGLFVTATSAILTSSERTFL